jgi:hypothetical protein
MPGSGGAAFGPATRGPFPLYACFDATVTTASGALVICGRFPALSCQLSLEYAPHQRQNLRAYYNSTAPCCMLLLSPPRPA